MAKVIKTVLKMPKGFKSREAASFVAQLDDQLENLREDMKGVTKAELEWQPRSGLNTIGMLMAHNAIVEVFWIQVVLGAGPGGDDIGPVLGIGADDDGMPIPATGTHPGALKGRPLAFYDRLFVAARAHTVKRLKSLTDADMVRRWRRTRANGEIRETDIRWVLYHLVEHFATHLGQMNLLRHQFRNRRRK